MGMGGKGGGGGKKEITPLSKQQLDILKDREAFYQNLTVPEMKEYFQDSKNFQLNNNYSTFTGTELAQGNVQNMNNAFNSQREQMQNSFAQRGLEGSGVEASGLSQLGAAQAQAVGNTVNQARLQSIIQRNQIIGQKNNNAMQVQGVRDRGLSTLLSQAPQPTRAMQEGMITVPEKKKNTGLQAGIGIAASLAAAYFTGGASLAVTTGGVMAATYAKD